MKIIGFLARIAFFGFFAAVWAPRAAQAAETNLPRPAPARPTPAFEDTSWRRAVQTRLDSLTPLPGSDAAADMARPALAQRMQAMMARLSGRSAVSVTVRDLETGTTVFDWRGDRALNPASNHKLLTTTAATTLLGPHFRFRTTVLREGNRLFLVGHGDPSLQTPDLFALAERVANIVDVTTIEAIVVDDTAFSSELYGPGYERGGPGHSYMAPSGAVSVQFNTVEIEVRPTTPGHNVAITVRPACDHVIIENRAITGRGRGLSITTAARGDKTVLRVSGRLAPQHRPVRERRRITDPGRFTGAVFARQLQQHGSRLLEIKRGRASSAAVWIAEHESQPLSVVLGSALKYSNNFTTEQLLRTLGHVATGAPGDWANGSAVVSAFWDGVGGDAQDLIFENASGLSRKGRWTTRGLVELMAWIHTSHTDAIIEALPVAGQEGTLRRRLTRSAGRVRAKTGTLAGATALTGVISDTTGTHKLGFSILVGGRFAATKARAVQDRLVRAMVDDVARFEE